MDLNLVRTFVTIFESRSLTVAAEYLFVTQPAVSQALSRLRTELDDPLFDRVGREMVATPFAQTVFPRFRLALEQIDGAIGTARTFDAESTDRVFKLALSELGEIGWLPLIINAVHRSAPQARIEVTPLEIADVEDRLSRGVVDLAITPAQLPARFARSHVKSQSYALAMARSNPMTAGEVTLDAYRDAAHVAVASDSGADLLDAAQRRAGIVLEPSVVAQHFATLPPLIARNSRLVATIPMTIARGWVGAWPIEVRPLPFPMEPIELSLYRRRSSQQSSALDWFHSTVAAAIEGSEGEFSSLGSRR